MVEKLIDYRAKYSVPPEYRNHLPETKDITWNDDYFEDDDDAAGIVAVFDFDYDKIVSFSTQVAFATQLVIVGAISFYLYLMVAETIPGLALVPTLFYLFTLAPCLTRYQIQWEAYAQHLVITRDGIRFVQAKRKSCWGFSICDRGKHSKTVPFDKITDCDIVEPAGNSCLIIPNILMVVNVDTASSGGEGKLHELVLTGLKDPFSFKKLVWAMKRAKEAQGGGPFSYYQAPSLAHPSQQHQPFANHIEMNSMEGTNKLCTDIDKKEIKGILQEIRDELRENNKLLRQQTSKKESDEKTKSKLEIV